MPSDFTVRQWAIDDVEGFASQYARSRDKGLDAVAEQCIAIADEAPGTVFPTGATDSGAVAHQRLRFDARRWYLSKLAPKRYGDRLEIDGKLEVDVATRIVAARKRAGTGE